MPCVKLKLSPVDAKNDHEPRSLILQPWSSEETASAIQNATKAVILDDDAISYEYLVHDGEELQLVLPGELVAAVCRATKAADARAAIELLQEAYGAAISNEPDMMRRVVFEADVRVTQREHSLACDLYYWLAWQSMLEPPRFEISQVRQPLLLHRPGGRGRMHCSLTTRKAKSGTSPLRSCKSNPGL